MISRILICILVLCSSFTSALFAGTSRGDHLIAEGGGVAGVAGAAGAAGPNGIAGIPGIGGVSAYAYIYNLSPQTVPQLGAVTFDSNGPITPNAFTHVTGSANITILLPGIYLVNFSISGVEPNQFTLFVNGVPAAGTTYGSGAGTQQNTGLSIITVPANTTLTLVNYLSAPLDGDLQTLAGGTQTNVNASVVILKLL